MQINHQILLIKKYVVGCQVGWNWNLDGEEKDAVFLWKEKICEVKMKF